MRRPLEERFWEKVDRSGGAEACWPWTASRVGKMGYGQFHIPTGHRPSQPVLAHRVALELKLGRPLAPGEKSRHSCDNPPCCNPAHLDVGTQQDNVNDMVDRGRHRTAHGARHPGAKLTAAAAAEIRERFAAGESKAALARTFGVHVNRITLIVTGKAWRVVEPRKAEAA